MSADISDALRNLEQSSKRLNELTDQASSVIHRVEQALGELSIGIGVFVDVKSPAVRKLGYFRAHDKQFRISVVDSDNTIRHWDGLSRDDKITAIVALPELLRRISIEIQNRVEKAEAALAEVSHFVPNQI